MAVSKPVFFRENGFLGPGDARSRETRFLEENGFLGESARRRSPVFREHHTWMKLSGSIHCLSSSWNFWLLSTTIWPSSASETLNRSSGRGAGPSKFTPEI